MIITLKKFLIFGIKEEIDRFFKAAQRAGFIEFIGQATPSLESDEIKEISQAIKVLKGLTPFPRRGEVESISLLVEKVIHDDLTLHSLHEKERMLRAEIDRLTPLGNFSVEDILFIEKEGGQKVQFFCISTSKTPQAVDSLIYINTEYDLDYYLSIQKDPVHYPDMIELIVDKPVGALKERLKSVHRQIKELEKELKGLAAFLPDLRAGLQDTLSRTFLKQVKAEVSFPTSEPLFVIEAWVPENHVDHLYKVMEKMAVHAEEIQIENGDRIPTYMENHGASRIGEDLVLVYDTPSPNDKDPSTWVLFSFAIFFAIITADAGYGCIYLLAALFCSFKFRNQMTRVMKRFIKLAYLLSFTCIVWGVMTAAFFGMKIDPNNVVRKSSLIHYLATKKAEYHLREKDDVYEHWVEKYPEVSSIQNGQEFFLKTTLVKDGQLEYKALDDFYDNVLMEIAFIIGVIHLICSMSRYAFRNYANFGWIFFTIGGYLFLPSSVQATSFVHFLGILPKTVAFPIGKYLFFGGFGLAILLGIIQKGIKGLLEIPNGIQIFSDVLSYLRLYALGLASMILAGTFNSLGGNLPLIFGIPVILAGQALTITLGLMGGLIHGLRLNFLEWYHYSFEGEGRLFNPLRKF